MGEHRPDDGAAGGGGGGGDGRFYGWPSSRIVRVSRATGGKDRHSKILTSKGTRDRRVRLSVNTAIQFYDLQDRLGYDQPSKAVEWLLTAAASSIAELPPMNCSFLVNPKQLSSAKMSSAAAAGGFQLGLDSGEVEIGRGGGRGSGNSKNSKGLGLSISRSENRSEARETAKEKENESSYVASFTELLSGKMSSINGGGHNSNSTNPDALIHQDYFTSGLLGLPTEQNHHHELQPFSFSFSGDNNVVSSPAINRGTLQSNSPPSPSLLPRFPAADGGSPPNLFVGGGDHRHHFLSGFDARLQLYYGQKEEEKN